MLTGYIFACSILGSSQNSVNLQIPIGSCTLDSLGIHLLGLTVGPHQWFDYRACVFVEFHNYLLCVCCLPKV